MIPWWVVLAAFVAGVGAAALAAEFGWLLQRAENGRGRGRSGEVAAAAPPYDWAEDIPAEPTEEQIARIMAAPPADSDPEPNR